MLLSERVRTRLAMPDGNRPEVDIILTHTELSFAHGTGILMSRVLAEAPAYALFRSFDNWGGRHDVDPPADYVLHRFSQDRTTIATFVATRLQWYRTRHIVAVPYTREDVIMALTAKAVTGMPLTIWIMDDNTLVNRGVPIAEMRELVSVADIRFAISEDLCDAYEGEFGGKFWVLPPLVARSLIRPEPSPPPDHAAGRPARAVIVGNIWHQGWLDDMLAALEGSGAEIDWFTSSDDLHFLRLDPARLAAAGVTIRSGVPHADIGHATAAADMVLVPSTSLRETDGHAAAIGRLSLPSKMPFVTASAGTPFLVLADGPSGAARYVERFGLGEVARYDPRSLQHAIAGLVRTARQQEIRIASHALAPAFDVVGTYELLTQSALTRRPTDDRFERLFARS